MILTNESDPNDYCYEDYVEWCEDNDIEPGDENSQDYYEWILKNTQENFDCDLDNIKTHKPWAVPVVVTGTLGLWWGHPEIKPERIESVYEAIQKCIGRDGDYVKVEFNDGKLDVQVSHHDGTNCFTIRALSKKGVQKKNGEYAERDFKRLNYLYA